MIIREELKAHHLTRSVVTQYLNIHANTLRKKLSSQNTFTVEELKKLKELGLSFDINEM